ncbi:MULTISPECIES: PIN domain-containing protein [unclassified Rhizobium]|uniref:PIN domain-containing protein n=1 Tax=unclassified Rhizobium TaxID=2613769 RepID=UPI001AE5F6B2|nr:MULTISPECIES: PIN domain-containing protein [unclassified Rhizobium]MBP2459566.1 putative nucleic acid-binding protein [Rhizobium sp. PvP014]MBP2531860.1 putative nucleic acid-binding protein [Rhizobium sp. PvP099]
MNLYIDTNIFLNFFHYSGEDIEQLRKIYALSDVGEIAFVLPDQVWHEFLRNRHDKIRSGFDEFRKFRFQQSVPAYCKNYPEYEAFRDLLKQTNAAHAALVKKVSEDIAARSLEADALIKNLFEKANLVSVDQAIYAAALERFRRGNPPGKKKETIGDEINWETLLSVVKDGEDLYIVSGDVDYRDDDTANFNTYLAAEWAERKGSSVIFYTSMSAFLKDNFPQVHLASDVAVNSLIARLSASGSYATTHALIAKLSKTDAFSELQAAQLVEAAELNNQVTWIINDDDVRSFYQKLLADHSHKLDPIQVEKLAALLDEEVVEPNIFD